MPNPRDIIRAARQALHGRLAIPALYYAAAGDTPVPVNVRLTDENVQAGQIPVGRERYGTFESDKPMLLFMRDEQVPARGAHISLEADECYRVEAVELPDDITVTARCVRVSVADCASFPPPSV